MRVVRFNGLLERLWTFVGRLSGWHVLFRSLLTLTLVLFFCSEALTVAHTIGHHSRKEL